MRVRFRFVSREFLADQSRHATTPSRRAGAYVGGQMSAGSPYVSQPLASSRQRDPRGLFFSYRKMNRIVRPLNTNPLSKAPTPRQSSPTSVRSRLVAGDR